MGTDSRGRFAVILLRAPIAGAMAPIRMSSSAPRGWLRVNARRLVELRPGLLRVPRAKMGQRELIVRHGEAGLQLADTLKVLDRVCGFTLGQLHPSLEEEPVQVGGVSDEELPDGLAFHATLVQGEHALAPRLDERLLLSRALGRRRRQQAGKRRPSWSWCARARISGDGRERGRNPVTPRRVGPYGRPWVAQHG
jgi:hypothetical protein